VAPSLTPHSLRCFPFHFGRTSSSGLVFELLLDFFRSIGYGSLPVHVEHHLCELFLEIRIVRMRPLALASPSIAVSDEEPICQSLPNILRHSFRPVDFLSRLAGFLARLLYYSRSSRGVFLCISPILSFITLSFFSFFRADFPPPTGSYRLISPKHKV